MDNTNVFGIQVWNGSLEILRQSSGDVGDMAVCCSYIGVFVMMYVHWSALQCVPYLNISYS